MSERLAHLRQLHQRTVEGDWTPGKMADWGPRDAEDAELVSLTLAALPHLLDIAEAARVECERSWSHSETPARRALREALNRLDQQP